jgi:hypothetical protein
VEKQLTIKNRFSKFDSAFLSVIFLQAALQSKTGFVQTTQ